MLAPDEFQTTRLLGYPDDARLLIVNADDFGMCHAGIAGTLRSMREGIVRSTTLMTPCPWAPYALHVLAENPDLPFGVHLTIVSEHPGYRWGPVASKHKVPSLLDEAGFFFSNDRSVELLAQAKIDEIEIEYRAQIATVQRAGLSPTHLDWHCLMDGGREDISDLTLGLAKEFGLALRASTPHLINRCRHEGLPVNDRSILDSYSMETSYKSSHYMELLRALPEGLSEWAVHPSLGDSEAQAMEPVGWDVRKADFDFLISEEAREIVEEEGIILLDYRALQQVWTSR